MPRELILVGLGPLPARIGAEVAAAARQVLGVGLRAGPSLGRPEYAFNETRKQFHAPAVLRRLAALPGAASGLPVLGLLDDDLFLPDDHEYVLGDADRGLGAGLVGLARLAGEPAEVKRRAQVESLHVLGHLLGLSLCLDYRCAMFPARDARDADRKAVGLCAGCRAALGLP
ncbi:MAG TPA: peptidase M54 [Anaeromyxobacter sp.]|nr:peptidase M54 [Anaeromyxobacter sp.]